MRNQSIPYHDNTSVPLSDRWHTIGYMDTIVKIPVVMFTGRGSDCTNADNGDGVSFG